MPPVIEVRNLSKTYHRYRADRPRSFQEVLAGGLRGLRATERFAALRDVSFSVPRGRTVGIIGTNGSGKSTLLRLIGGVGTVDTGSVSVQGRIRALFDLGSGFHTDLSGRENAIVASVLSGLTRKEALQRLEQIVAFAGIEKFIDNPMRTYSSGMHMRLAFSTAIHTSPEILLIDEVLSVGDTAFQRKCLDRIAQFKADGCSILLVSHSLAVVQTMCDEAVWLNAGQLMAYDSARDVVKQYLAHVSGGREVVVTRPRRLKTGPTAVPALEGLSPHPDAAAAARALHDTRDEPVDLELGRVWLLDDEGHPVSELQTGQPLRIAIEFEAAEALVAPLFQVRVVREDGVICCDLSTKHSELSRAAVTGRGSVTLALDRLDLNSGRYRFDVWAYADDWAYPHDHRASACSLLVFGDGVPDAVLNVPHHWELDIADDQGPPAGG